MSAADIRKLGSIFLLTLASMKCPLNSSKRQAKQSFVTLFSDTRVQDGPDFRISGNYQFIVVVYRKGRYPRLFKT